MFMSTIDKIIPIPIVLEKNPLKTRRKSCQSQRLHKLRRKKIYVLPCNNNRKQNHSPQRSNKRKSTKELTIGSRKTNRYGLMKLLTTGCSLKNSHFQSDLGGIFSTTYHSNFEKRNFRK